MNHSIPADFHIHTHHSGDSEAPMRDVIEVAIKRGLPAICFTEHMDIDYPPVPDLEPGLFELDTDAYYKEYKELSAEYADRIPVFFGVEVGMQPHLVQTNSDYVKQHPFDFVIGSNHVCYRKDPYYPSYYEGRSETEAFNEFFESTLENISKFNNFDVLGHLDYIVRYSPTKYENYSYGKYSDIIDEILRTLINKEKGLDVNTKSMYSNSPSTEPNPSRDILMRYLELGGEIITLGSDAHYAEQVGGAFEQTASILKDCGFKYYATFNSRMPEFHPL